MVRRYVPKRQKQLPRDSRMAAVIELRTMGYSLRKIADRIGVSEGTIRNDLKRWEQQRANVAPLVRNPARKSAPQRGEITHPDYAPGTTTNIVPIRRSS